MRTNIDDFLVEIEDKYPYLGLILACVTKVSIGDVPEQAYGCVYLSRYGELFIRVKKGMTKKQTKDTLLHELAHINLGHLFADRKVYSNPLKLNIAQDLAVNSLLKNVLGKGGYFPTGLNLPDDKTFNWYYKNLKDIPDNYQPAIILKQGGTSKEQKEGQKKLKQKIEAVRQLREELEKKFIDFKVKKKSATRKRLHRLNPVPSRPAKNRISRRYGEPAGRKNTQRNEINLIIDNSGSIEKGKFVRFLEDIKGLNVKIRQVIACNYEVNYNSKRLDVDTICQGTGYTSFSPAIRVIKKKNIPTLYYTDLGLNNERWDDVPKLKNLIWVVYGADKPDIEAAQKLGDVVVIT